MKIIVRNTKLTPEERETHLNFDYIDKVWYMDSSIPRHISKALKTGWTPIEKHVYEDGTVCSMRFMAAERGITIKTPIKREMSEEHKAKLLGGKIDDLEEEFED